MTPEKLDMYKRLQSLFKEKMGVPQGNDFVCVGTENNNVIAWSKFRMSSGEYTSFIRLPLPIDPINPERGLLEMIA